MTWLILICVFFGVVMGLTVYGLLDMWQIDKEERNHD